MSKQIIATVPLVGISSGKRKPTFEADGFTGESCRTATEAFEQAMGTTSDEVVKPEMYDTEQRHEHLNS